MPTTATISPTGTPTEDPTPYPTDTPTNATPSPTNATAAPTSKPTEAPTDAPTSYPTSQPTQAEHLLCKSETNFMPDAPVSWWCNLSYVSRHEEACTAAGCFPVPGLVDECICFTKSTCEKMGGTYQPAATCKEELLDDDEFLDALREADAKGTCLGVHMPWGEPLINPVDRMARLCCSDYPNTACAPNAVVSAPMTATMCKDSADFLPDAVESGWCNTHGLLITKESCQNAGCDAWEYSSCVGDDNCNTQIRCNCFSEIGCDAVGGTYSIKTCQEFLDALEPAERGLLERAAVMGHCDGLSSHGQALPSAYSHAMENCCASYPANMCAPDFTFPSLCASPDQFKPDETRYHSCRYPPHTGEPTTDNCADAGFCNDSGACSCNSPEACTHFGGTFVYKTCRASIDSGFAKALQLAVDAGTCADAEFADGTPLEQVVDQVAETCCSDYPATLCSTM